jgi:hypothetical protein
MEKHNTTFYDLIMKKNKRKVSELLESMQVV